MAQIKEKITFKDFINKLFGTSIDFINKLFGTSIDDEFEEITDSNLLIAQKNTDNMGKSPTEPLVLENNKSSKNGGFSNELKENTLQTNETTVKIEKAVPQRDDEEINR